MTAKKRGRKPGRTKRMYSTRLKNDVVDWLRKQKNQGALIEAALVKTYNLPGAVCPKPATKKDDVRIYSDMF